MSSLIHDHLSLYANITLKACPKKGILDSGFDWKLWAQKLYRTWNILRSEDDNLKVPEST